MKKIYTIVSFVIGFSVAIAFNVNGAVLLTDSGVKNVTPKEISRAPVSRVMVEPVISQPAIKTIVKSDLERILELEARVSALEEKIK